jgi:NAD(P)-dependent dehydrogenase (short-subunit alcohol dehydrogenase family)
MTKNETQNALVTGGSRGLGRAITDELLARGWRVVVDARPSREFDGLTAHAQAIPVAGDIRDPLHRAALAAAVDVLGGLDLLVNNASTLGPSPLPTVSSYPLGDLELVLQTNVVAPLALIQLVLPALRRAGGVVVSVSSDAAVEAYPGWGGYGASKAALDQLTAVLGVEEAGLRVYGFDPGDMRTAMHQLAFPGEDISDRPEPATVVPALLQLLAHRPPSGRYRASELAADETAGVAR